MKNFLTRLVSISILFCGAAYAAVSPNLDNTAVGFSPLQHRALYNSFLNLNKASTVTSNPTFTGTTQINTLNVGASGTAGSLSLFSGTASKGKWLFTPVDNTGNTTLTITNAAQGQATTLTIPDCGSAAGNFVLNVGANGTEASNAVTASGLSGVITTSSLTTTGGSNYAITWTNTKIASTSKVLVSLAGGTNTTNNITLKAVPGSGTATLTIYNNTASTALNGTIIIHYFVIP